ncbi:DUF6711 family protein [Adlercreutzia sp. ZJ242]|uniref:DUF6711 family protein n=1 Tax=Adlercreutzia sp. ZJ242 TaxID=2709409 RepID=UPI00197E0B1A|nr:DUF6711 family protein [Adlercreutzia sp. ZJ242]
MPMLYVGSSASSLTPISLDPAQLTWGLQDISAADAGRVQDAGNTMYKMRTSQKRKMSITWNFPTAAQASEILKAFNPEYVYVRYHDPMENSWNVRQFYVGDRSAPFKWFNLKARGTRHATLSFDIIER